MNDVLLLDHAIRIATHAHFGQRDKAGMPYILHPLRVMMAMSTDFLKTIAVLHDVVEDSNTDLRNAGFPAEIIRPVEVLTRTVGEPYEAYIERVKNHPSARKVKIADLKDNLSPDRIRNINQSLIARYVWALGELEDAY